MKRLFVALDLPDDAKDALQELRAPSMDGVRWTDPRQLHLTLVFLGDAEPEPIIEALEPVPVEPFPLRPRGVGRFKRAGRKGVLWVGFEPSDALADLQHRIADALTGAGVRRDKRPYRPHLTLARYSPRASEHQIRGWLKQHRDITVPSIEVRQWILYSSRLLPSGAEHTRERVGG